MATLNTAATPKILYTSLAEIKSFDPCIEGWRNILEGQGKTKADDVLFPILEAVESNSIADICWLLGKRKVEIQICVKFARMCADSVQKYKNTAAAAATAANYAYAAAYYANSAAYYTANSATDAAYAAEVAADAADVAADAAADVANIANASYAAAYKQQKELNKQFLIHCINEYQNGTL